MIKLTRNKEGVTKEGFLASRELCGKCVKKDSSLWICAQVDGGNFKWISINNPVKANRYSDRNEPLRGELVEIQEIIYK